MTYVVSLSGGVDSMVIATILKHLNCALKCVHINYKNRTEADSEACFVEHWCDMNGIPFECHVQPVVRGGVERRQYEEESRDFRFRVYRDVLERTVNSESIILGHHDDDIVETVFFNMMKSHDLLNLTVMKKESTMLGVDISRPLIGFHKSYVYDFAHKYGVPYTKNSTPSWSLRGAFRERILPLLEEKFGNVSSNLLHLSIQSDEWGDLVVKQLIQPFWNTIEFTECAATIPLSTTHRAYPACFWRHVATKIFHRFHTPMFSNKSLKT